jgi:hypothetical protein
LERMPGGTLDVPRVFSLPPLNADDQTSMGISLTWPVPDRDLYYLILELDEADSLVEQNEDNNRYERVVPVVLSATLSPTTTTVLTSTSGAVQFIFPAGAVTTPTQIVYTPLWPAGWATGLLKTSIIAFSLTATLNGQPAPLTFARPVSLTWRYGDADVAGLDEENLRLFLAHDGRWDAAACQPYRRDLDQNQLTTGVCRTGVFVFGSRFDLYMPLFLHFTTGHFLNHERHEETNDTNSTRRRRARPGNARLVASTGAPWNEFRAFCSLVSCFS